jgi:DNA-binding NtrC family response regulator
LLTLEEARAIKRLADALAAVCHARGIQARALAREHELTLRADRAEEEGEKLRHEIALDVGRHALAAARLARPATVGVYAASSRMALDAIERRIAVSAPIAVVAPSGTDPVPYLARAHLAGPRSAKPLVIVDATSAREHDLARWSEAESSPLALADRGTLVLLDGAALPIDVQRLIARSLTERRPPWEQAEPLDVAFVLTGARSPDELVEAGRLEPNLATRLGDARESPIELPRLRDRPEDIRAILTDRLAREGLRVKGVPVGIEAAAYARLIEHTFPGEDAELATIVMRLVAACPGDVVRAVDVDALKLFATEEPEPTGATHPSKSPPKKGTMSA